MQTTQEAREARRRRILERSSDRLAYITGDASKQRVLRVSSASPSQGASSVTFQNTAEQSDNDVKNTGNVSASPQYVPQSQLSQASSEAPAIMQVPPLRERHLDEATIMTSAMGSSNSDSPRSMKMKKADTAYMKNIIQGIDASETVRALAAVIVAVFWVIEYVLSCCGNALGTTLAVFSPRWPLGLVFITDLTLVIGAYLMRSQMKFSQKDSGVLSQAEGLDGSSEKMSKALDVVGQFEDIVNLGLLCKKAVGALSLDCSIYAVTLVCSLSICDYLLFSCRVD